MEHLNVENVHKDTILLLQEAQLAHYAKLVTNVTMVSKRNVHQEAIKITLAKQLVLPALQELVNKIADNQLVQIVLPDIIKTKQVKLSAKPAQAKLQIALNALQQTELVQDVIADIILQQIKLVNLVLQTVNAQTETLFHVMQDII